MVLVVVIAAGVTAFLNLRTVKSVATSETRQRLGTETRLLAAALMSWVGNPVGDVLATRHWLA